MQATGCTPQKLILQQYCRHIIPLKFNGALTEVDFNLGALWGILTASDIKLLVFLTTKR